jgi:hypothetical protein
MFTRLSQGPVSILQLPFVEALLAIDREIVCSEEKIDQLRPQDGPHWQRLCVEIHLFKQQPF